MFRYALMVAAALSLFSSANACTCFPPPALSECAVGDDTAALLVTMKCVKSVICDINSGVAVVDVVIDKVFKDNTNLGLSVGDMVTVRSLTQSATCGIGLSFEAGAQWILFGRAPPPPEPIDDFTIGGRRLQQPSNNNAAVATDFVAILDRSGIDDKFSDGSVCEVGDADLSTNLCSGNIIEPTQNQINQLMNGCNSITVPPILTSRTSP